MARPRRPHRKPGRNSPGKPKPAPHAPGSPDKEFGVPVPGDVLPQEKWSQTALKAMPVEGFLDWPALFGRTAPVALDLGCGNGRSTITSAILHPDTDHLGVDILPVVLRYARKRGNQRGLRNLKFAVLGNSELLAKYVAPESVAEVAIYHPQPYHDPAERHRRLISPEFLELVRTTLAPGGRVIIQTDSPRYWKVIQELMPQFFEFHERIGRWPDSPHGRTRREIYAIKRGLPVFRGVGTKPGLPDSVAAVAERAGE